MEREAGGRDGRAPARASAGLDPAGDDLGVGAELGGDHDHEAALAVDAAFAEAGLRRLRHPPEIAKPQDRARLAPAPRWRPGRRE